jgi:hypothetical protein
MSILWLSKQPLVGCHIRNRYWHTPRTSMTFANHDLSMNTQHAWPYKCCHIGTQSKSPRKVVRLSFHLICMHGLRRECYCLLPLHPTFQKSQKGSILNSHINCSCRVEDPASILYASHICKACPEGSLLLIWHNDHTVHSSWKQWWSKGLYNSPAGLSIQPLPK